MITFYLISLLAFTGYVTYLLCKFGVPVSISESYYLIPGKWGPMAFAGFSLSTALPLMIFWLMITEGTGSQCLAFLSCAPLLFVGAAGAFKGFEMTRRVHYVAAAMCGVFSQLWIALNGWMWITAIVLFAVAFVLSRRYKGVRGNGMSGSALLFFAEVAAFVAIYAALLCYYILGK